jgi:hypothetical protein
VKGNPKGLMRAVRKPSERPDVFWFYTTVIGKHSYANIIVSTEDGAAPPFEKEGAFAEWENDPNKRYHIVRYTIDGAKLAVNWGNSQAFVSLMETRKTTMAGGFFFISSGWLTKYLEKNDPDKIYDDSEVYRFTRAKK